MAVFEEKTCEKMNKIGACVILLIVVLSCSVPVNNRQLKTTESLTQNIASSDTIKDVLNENTVKDFSTVALGMKYRTKKEWNDFTEPDREEYIITSKGLGKLFGIQDSVFADNDGTILSEENPVVLCDYISANKYEYPNWLIISTQNKSEGQYTLTGVIRINEGTTYSVHCKLKDDYYAGCVCVGKYPIMNGDSILFRIEEIYGITKTGKVDILPLNTPVENCPEPFEPTFPEGRIPAYYYVQGDEKHTQSWQEL